MKIKRIENAHKANINQNADCVTILLSDKVDSGTRSTTPDKVKHSMIEGSVPLKP